MISRFLLYLNTVRYLKISQIFYRVYYKIKKVKYNNKLKYNEEININVDDWVAPVLFTKFFRDGLKFEFIGESHEFQKISWYVPTKSKLWNYNLNYFEFLFCSNNKNNVDDNINLIHSWIESASQKVSYDPYPVSLRIVNWIKFVIHFKIDDEKINNSIYCQSNYLFKRIEYHLLGNHILENCKALIYAGLYFNNPISSRWLDKGLRLLIRELNEQVNKDGSHFELSPMYHAIVMELMLDVLNILSVDTVQSDSADEVKKFILENVPPMYQWLESVTHMDGCYAHFNDSTNGVAPSVGDIYNYCHRLGIPVQECSGISKFYEDSGIVVLRNDQFKLLIDAGPVGASYQPGHAHADSLSFELSLNGEKILGNTGISTYDTNSRRLFERGTSAHSTVTINDRNSSEVWGSFRLARRAEVTRMLKNVSDKAFHLKLSHNGFNKIYNYGYHFREFMVEANKITIMDSIDPPSPEAKGRIITVPGLNVEKEKNIITLSTKRGHKLLISANVELECCKSFYSSGFNDLSENVTISYRVPKNMPVRISMEMIG